MFVTGAFYVATGSVGIGTVSPSQLLEVVGGEIKAGRVDSSNEGGQVSFGRSTDNATAWYIDAYGNVASPQLRFVNVTNAVVAMTITGSNVGIGTSTPAAKLEIQDGHVRLYNAVSTAGAGYAVIWATDAGGTNTSFATIEGVTTTEGVRRGDIKFNTSNAGAPSEKMRITSGGYLKASNNGSYSTGTTHELVNSVGGNYAAQFSNTHPTSPFGIQIYYPNTLNNTTNRFIDCEDNAALRFSARSNGGLANFQANDVNLSDERTKKDIIPLESYWDKFKAIEIVKFKYKDQTHDDFNIGVIAQQVEKVAPEFVDVDGWDNKPKLDEDGNIITNNEEPLKSIYTADLHHATIKVLQEAMAKIETLEAQNDDLQSQINELKAQ
jgi:hypothetical protein